MKQSKNKKAIAITLIAIAVIIIILSIVLAILTNKNKETDSAVLQEEAKKIYDDGMIAKLSEMTEGQRMKTYLADFIEKIEKKDYDSAYDFLYSDFKENYFKTLTEFENYCEEYFPAIFNVTTDNMERLNNIYVLELTVMDLVNTGRDFEMYFVIRENELNDYDLSFSVNSAIDA